MLLSLFLKATDDAGNQMVAVVVFYPIYPRSFADGNGDGTGDFRSMVAKLDSGGVKIAVTAATLAAALILRAAP